MDHAWQLQLFRRSLKKQETVRALLDHLPPVEGRVCLELGCATGLTSHFLRERGGTWVSCDFERGHVRSARQLVRDRSVQTGETEVADLMATELGWTAERRVRELAEVQSRYPGWRTA